MDRTWCLRRASSDRALNASCDGTRDVVCARFSVPLPLPLLLVAGGSTAVDVLASARGPSRLPDVRVGVRNLLLLCTAAESRLDDLSAEDARGRSALR